MLMEILREFGSLSACEQGLVAGVVVVDVGAVQIHDRPLHERNNQASEHRVARVQASRVVVLSRLVPA